MWQAGCFDSISALVHSSATFSFTVSFSTVLYALARSLWTLLSRTTVLTLRCLSRPRTSGSGLTGGVTSLVVAFTRFLCSFCSERHFRLCSERHFRLCSLCSRCAISSIHLRVPLLCGYDSVHVHFEDTSHGVGVTSLPHSRRWVNTSWHRWCHHGSVFTMLVTATSPVASSYSGC